MKKSYGRSNSLYYIDVDHYKTLNGGTLPKLGNWNRQLRKDKVKPNLVEPYSSDLYPESADPPEQQRPSGTGERWTRDDHAYEHGTGNDRQYRDHYRRQDERRDYDESRRENRYDDYYGQDYSRWENYRNEDYSQYDDRYRRGDEQSYRSYEDRRDRDNSSWERRNEPSSSSWERRDEPSSSSLENRRRW